MTTPTPPTAAGFNVAVADDGTRVVSVSGYSTRVNVDVTAPADPPRIEVGLPGIPGPPGPPAECLCECECDGVGSTLPPFNDMDHPFPYVSAHRGGSYIVPEGTRLGRLNALGLGMQVIDGGDIHATLDGVLYDMHDSTVDRTTNLTGPIDQLSSMRMMQAELDCSRWFGGGWVNQPVTSIVDTLNDLGGKVYVTFEVKTDVDAQYAQKIVDLVARYGLTEQTLIASFSEPLLKPAIDAGHPVMLLGTDMVDESNDTGLLDRGVLYVGGNQSMTSATAKKLMDNGLRVCAYSTEQHTDVDKYANGVSGHLWGYMCDDPFYLRGHIEGSYDYRLTSDPFDTLTYYHGFQADNLSVNPTSRGHFVEDPNGSYFCSPVGSLQRRAWLQGWGCPLVDTSQYTINYEQKWNEAASSAGGCLVFGCPTDRQYTGDDQPGGGQGGPPGYECWMFSSGLMRIFRRDEGAVPVQLATLTTNVDIDPNTPQKLRVQVDGSTITFTHVTSGTKLTASDGRYRGGYFHLLANDNGAQAGLMWRNISIA